ncbi:MAG TPA: peptide deformylase [Sneathiellales bacterium]|nr:peptide deformylase [Sneathiellales bacterium]
MTKLSIITAPDPRLKVVSEPVAQVDAGIQRLMDDMLETMYAAPGIGLAAVQVGVPKRVVIVDTGEQGEQDKPLFLINPEVLFTSDETWIDEEGCLSLPDQYADVRRPVVVKLKFLDYTGVPQEMEARGLLATCIQHELDHLEGILFVDHISMLRRGIILKKLRKIQRESAAAER